MPRRSILPLAFALLALAPVAASAAGIGTTFLTGGLDLPAGATAGGLSGYADDESARIGVSDDGRFVAFSSEADLLDPAANPDTANVYRKDRLTGTVVLVSRATGAAGTAPAQSSADAAISEDGAVVAFRTTAALDPADADGGEYDVYLRDVGAGTTTLATVADGGGQTLEEVNAFDLSGDGRFVAFATQERVDPVNDTTAFDDVYRRDLAAGRTALVSRRAGSGAAANGSSYVPAISDDGRWVAFVSAATDLVSGYVGSGTQVFVRDVGGALGYLVSNRATLSRTASNGSFTGEVDIAGAPAALAAVVVAYDTNATDVSLGGVDASSASSVYVHAMSATSSTLVSVSDGGANADSRAHTPTISDDGSRVEFDSDAQNLTTDPDYYGVYLRDLTAGRTLLASVGTMYSVQGALSGGGALVSWYSGTGVTPDSDPDTGGVFGRPYAPPAMGAAELVSRPPGSAPFLLPAIVMDPFGAGERTISADGRYVVFRAYTTTRLPGGGIDSPGQVYRRDVLTSAIELVSRANGATGAAGNGFSDQPTISGDGTRVAFRTSSQFDPAHPAATNQAYVRDMTAGTTTLVSRADGAGGTGGAPSDADVSDPRISADGQHLAFVSGAANLGVPGGVEHVWLRDIAGGRTTLIDRATGADGAAGNFDADDPSPSRDGRYVAFNTSASNLDPDDAADRLFDVYVRDTVAGTTTLVSRGNGSAGAHARGSSTEAAISADGAVVAFRTTDETLAPEGGAWGGTDQIVARTLATGANALVSRAPGPGAVANADAAHPTVSGDGAVIAFDSEATNLLPGLGGTSRPAVFARTMAGGAVAGPPAFGLVDNPLDDMAVFPAISDNGNCLAFRAHGHNAITGTAGDFDTSYMYVVSGECPTPAVARALPTRAARSAPRPALTRASLLRKRFRVGRRPTAKVAARAQSAARRRGRGRRVPRARVGTAFRFTLNTQARVTIVLERPAEGRLVGRFCRRPARRLRRNLRCVRFVEVGRLTRTGVRAGRSSVAFSGRIGRKALRPGTYRARLRASNGSGVSRWVRRGFRVVRR